MYKSPLKVFGEYLVPTAALATSKTGVNVIRAGKSMSGLEAVLCVEEYASSGTTPVNLNAGKTYSITILHSDDGIGFTTLGTYGTTLAEAKVAEPGTIIARVTLPCDCKTYIKANYSTDESTLPVCNVSVFLSYLPR